MAEVGAEGVALLLAPLLAQRWVEGGCGGRGRVVDMKRHLQ